ncbi:hypothetical protein F2P81_008968 [Scophthalmus maximus]|uniref:ASD2 domain-containing protein n=1 Tax=Scophthalmus maximus TaxID=52904 RepID=A0A6A4T5L0_SCOMX|nr:hypothetical protein F2P81_008968 [Scophthalmus maximus]
MCLSRKQTAQRALLGKYYVTYCNLADVMIQRSSFSSAEKANQSLDSRHRLLCKQREDAKDLKDNLDRRENLVSTFLSRQLSAEQLRDYRRFVQTQASLLIRQKDLEEKQRLGEEQLEALSHSLRL